MSLLMCYAYKSVVGFHRYVVSSSASGSLDEMVEHQINQFDPPSEVRAIIEGQFLSMRGHAERCGLPVPPKRIIATGGASSNQIILKTMASIFGCSVYTVQRPGIYKTCASHMDSN
jgi:xylulokinase